MNNINNASKIDNSIELNFLEQLSKHKHFKKIFKIKLIRNICEYHLVKRIFDHKITKKFMNRETIMYLIFGFLATALNIFALAFFRYVVGIDFYVANFLAIICSVIFAFFTNKIWVFRSKTHTFEQSIKEFFRFISARSITMISEILGVPFLALVFTILGMQTQEAREMLSKGIFAIFVIIANYIFSKKAIFNK